MDTPNDAKKKLPKTEEQLYDELSKAIVFEKDEDGNLTVDKVILKLDDSEVNYILRQCAELIVENHPYIDQSAAIARLRMENERLEIAKGEAVADKVEAENRMLVMRGDKVTK